MSAPFAILISRQEELTLHQRLVDGDLTASAEIANIFIEPLINWLRAKNSLRISDELCIEAAEDAWIALARNPGSFKPQQGTRLGYYLCMSAQGDLRNRLQKEQRRREKSLETVQLSAQDGKYLETVDDPSLQLRICEEAEGAEREILPLVREGLSDGETRVLGLILQGERKTAHFARALGIDHLPKKEQVDEVNRVKNKIKKRIKRGQGGDGRSS